MSDCSTRVNDGPIESATLDLIGDRNEADEQHIQLRSLCSAGLSGMSTDSRTVEKDRARDRRRAGDRARAAEGREADGDADAGITL